MKHLKKYWWEAVFAVAMIAGVASGIVGFMKQGASLGDAAYEVTRVFQMEHDANELTGLLTATQWFLFFAFLWLLLKILLTIIAPLFLSLAMIRFFYSKHLIVCGLNQMTSSLVKNCNSNKVVVIAEELNSYAESLKHKGIKIIVGEPAEGRTLKLAGILRAKQLFAICSNDNKNVEIASCSYNLLKDCKKTATSEAFRCYTLIRDRELKAVLEEAPLFREDAQLKKQVGMQKEQLFFDAILFNICDYGVKYGISGYLDKILPAPLKAPSFMLLGLTDMTECIIIGLAHCLTINKESFSFTVVTSDEAAIAAFKQKTPWLEQFIDLSFASDIKQACMGKSFNSIFVCLENQMDAIKTALKTRYHLVSDNPAIFILSVKNESLDEILREDVYDTSSNGSNNIHEINLYEATFHSLFMKNEEIEHQAEEQHNRWRKSEPTSQYNVPFSQLPEHYRQANRNRVLDSFLCYYLIKGRNADERVDDLEEPLSQQEAEALGMIEHNRWMIEKYNAGWVAFSEKSEGVARLQSRYEAQIIEEIKAMSSADSNLSDAELKELIKERLMNSTDFWKKLRKFKIHRDLRPWDELSCADKMKDFEAALILFPNHNINYNIFEK